VGRADDVTTATIPADRAAEAWAMMARAENPFPAWAAVDWLRQVADTDDVDAVKRALYAAAADELLAREKEELGFDHVPGSGGWRTSGAIVALREADWGRVARQQGSDGQRKPGVPRKPHNAWSWWWYDVSLYTALCRAVEAA
jgi:hypothetical protein